MPRGNPVLNEQRVEGSYVRTMSGVLIETVPTPFPENRIKTPPGSGSLRFGWLRQEVTAFPRDTSPNLLSEPVKELPLK